jgi:hypothetical protein
MHLLVLPRGQASAEDYLWSSAPRKAEMTLGSAGRTACATCL